MSGCIFHSDCRNDHYCDSSDQKCKKTAKEADPCQSDTSCPQNTHCHSTHKRCRKTCAKFSDDCELDPGTGKYLERKVLCSVEEDCGLGKYCFGSTLCLDNAKKGSSCSAKEPCEEGLECSSGTCVNLCNKKHDCAGGLVCDYKAMKPVGICTLHLYHPPPPEPVRSKNNGTRIALGIVIPLIIIAAIIVAVVVYKKKKKSIAKAASNSIMHIQPMPPTQTVFPQTYTPQVHTQYPDMNMNQSNYQQQYQSPAPYINDPPNYDKNPPPSYY